MSQVFIFYGKAGSGKGTQAEKLADHIKSAGKPVLVIETGKLFRGITEHPATYAEQQVKNIIDNGNLMPAFFPVYLWSRELIEKYTPETVVIFDGVTRKVEEVAPLVSALEFLQIQTATIIHIDIADTTAINRLSIRGDRADDQSVSLIQKRLDLYREQIIPAINQWEQISQSGSSSVSITTYHINGELDRNGVWEQIEQLL